MLYKVTNNQTI